MFSSVQRKCISTALNPIKIGSNIDFPLPSIGMSTACVSGRRSSLSLGDLDLIIPVVFPLRLPSLRQERRRDPSLLAEITPVLFCPSRPEDDKLEVPARSYLVKSP
ncbi:hypothetical protein ACVWXE_001742 [Thermostichus sp. MS-CIW-41]